MRVCQFHHSGKGINKYSILVGFCQLLCLVWGYNVYKNKEVYLRIILFCCLILFTTDNICFAESIVDYCKQNSDKEGISLGECIKIERAAKARWGKVVK